MIRLEMLGRVILLLGVLFLGSGAVIYLFESPQDVPNTYCIGKSPIYCYKTLHGILFDTGCLLILAGIIILLLCSIMQLRKTKASN
jgi:predicted membrane channel-forming protein YqfA (hemolysin III family)